MHESRHAAWHRGVLLLTARDLQFRATRFASAILGTAVVFTMVFLMTGVTEQFHREPRQVVDELGSDAWLLRDGASGAFTSSETLPVDIGRRIRGVDVAPLVTARHSITQGEERTDVVIAGFTPGGIGQPEVAAGSVPAKPGEVAIDRTSDIALGEDVTIGATSFTVVGHTARTTLFAGMPFVFMPIGDAQQLVYQGQPLATTLLLSEAPTRVPRGFAVLDGEAVAADAVRPLDGAVSSVNLIRVLLWFVAAMIIGTLTYLSSLDRRRDVAVLKALGTRTSQLGASIALQGVLVALAAVALATALQAFLVPVFPLEVAVPRRAFVQLPVIAVLVALVSGAAGLRKAVGVDPASAFSGPGQ